MPALVRWPGRVPAGSTVNALVSTLDVLPTILSFAGMSEYNLQQMNLDGVDLSHLLLGEDDDKNSRIRDRVLFFWRDGFADGPLPPPFGRFDVVAAKVGRIKAWFWTKSAHYNSDTEIYHDPPLLFDTISDPAEGHPLDPNLYKIVIHRIKLATAEHKRSVNWTYPGPLTLDRDPKYIPCSNRSNRCRTPDENEGEASVVQLVGN
jgi:hypothetical protein